MRDLLCEPPDYRRVEWDPADLDRMQCVLQADRRDAWPRRLRYHVAWLLFGRRGLLILPEGALYEDIEKELSPSQRKRLDPRVGWLRTWLGRLVAPVQPPFSRKYNLLELEARLPVCLRLDRVKDCLALNGDPLDDPVLVSEWALFRYSRFGLPVNIEPYDGQACTNSYGYCGQATGGRRIRVEASFRRTGDVEEIKFEELPQ